MKSRPTFLVIGAQKCGTTSLYWSLKQHPGIYMSPVKEPRYFAFADGMPDFTGPGADAFKRNTTVDLENYAALFAPGDACTVRGEASPVYLSGYQPDVTAGNIRKTLPDVRLVAVLRQPAERAWSAFLHHRKLGLEPLRDFKEALAQERVRKARNWYPGWRYFENGLYAHNIKPYFDLFERRQIRVYLHDEWSLQPAQVLRDMFGFLGVDPTFQLTVTPQVNRSLFARSRILEKILSAPSPVWCEPLANRIRLWNRHKPVVPRRIRADLTRAYTPEIQALEGLLDRDLGHWLHSP